jgi:lipoprotein-anchoring transpeptidase ErfK/SrfK
VAPGILEKWAGIVAIRTPVCACVISKDRLRRGIEDVKGDRVEIVVDAGDTTRTYEVVAGRAGRRVETAVRRGVVEVSEVTRNGSVVRTARFMANRVLALVEQPVPRGADGDRE